MTPNRYEAEALTGIAVTDRTSALAAARPLLAPALLGGVAAAHVAKTVLQRPPAEAFSAEDSATCCARCQDSPSAASCGGLLGRGLGDVLRTYGIEVRVCPQGSGVRRVLAAIHDPAAIARVLLAMGLPSAAPEQAGCRAPPAGGGLDDASEGAAE